jgi:hypothetical protein
LVVESLLINRTIARAHVECFMHIIYFRISLRFEVVIYGVLGKRATLALFTIAIVSSLLVSSLAGSAFAAKKRVYREHDDFSKDKDSLQSSSANTYDLSEDIEDEKKNLNSKSLSTWEAAAAADNHLTFAEQRECYRAACNDDD